MHEYAQTILQLFNQLRENDYSQNDLEFIYKTYQVAIRKFSGLYRPSGKTFIDHVVGTASILVSLKAPIAVVATGLIHSIYNEGDFGVRGVKITDSKREQIRHLVGSEVEIYLFKYAKLIPDHKSLTAIYNTFDQLDPIDRQVLLIRLADRLEDCLDLGILYCFNRESVQHYINTSGQLMVDMASMLGYEKLAKALQDAFELTKDAHGFQGLQGPETWGKSYLVPPVSNRKRWLQIFLKH